MELENNGLQAALTELASRVSRTNVNCVVKAPTFTKVYDNAAAIHLYRIAQEAVNNAIKHGRAKNITIGLNTQNNQQCENCHANGGEGFIASRRTTSAPRPATCAISSCARGASTVCPR